MTPRMRLLVIVLVAAALGLLYLGCGSDPSPESRCEKVCNTCEAKLDEGATVDDCISECKEEYRATDEQESCIDEGADCNSLLSCGDFW